MRKQNYTSNRYQNSIYNDPPYDDINSLRYSYDFYKKWSVYAIVMIIMTLAIACSSPRGESLSDIISMYNLGTGNTISTIKDVIVLIFHDSESCKLCRDWNGEHTLLTEKLRDAVGPGSMFAMLSIFYIFGRIQMHKIKAELKRLGSRNF